MKRAIIAIIAAVALTTPALAQSTTTVTTGTANATVTVAPEQRTKIKTYITEHKIKPVTVKERITVGATLRSHC